jgi:hypothetical protein
MKKKEKKRKFNQSFSFNNIFLNVLSSLKKVFLLLCDITSLMIFNNRLSEAMEKFVQIILKILTLFFFL